MPADQPWPWRHAYIRFLMGILSQVARIHQVRLALTTLLLTPWPHDSFLFDKLGAIFFSIIFCFSAEYNFKLARSPTLKALPRILYSPFLCFLCYWNLGLKFATIWLCRSTCAWLRGWYGKPNRCFTLENWHIAWNVPDEYYSALFEDTHLGRQNMHTQCSNSISSPVSYVSPQSQVRLARCGSTEFVHF